MELQLKSLLESNALYEAIETQLEGMAVDSPEKGALLGIRSRLEQVIANERDRLDHEMRNYKGWKN